MNISRPSIARYCRCIKIKDSLKTLFYPIKAWHVGRKEAAR